MYINNLLADTACEDTNNKGKSVVNKDTFRTFAS